MTFDEAIKKVLELVPDEKLAEFSETIDVIKNSQNTDSGEDWEKKYKELSIEYRKRFIDSLNKGPGIEEKTETKDDTEEEEKEIEIKDLDFSADTE